MAWDYTATVEKMARETDNYVERILPMQIQVAIDETVYNTVSKKGDLLKAFNDFEKFKFKMLEEKLKASHAFDRKTFTIPNFNVRDLEV